MSLAGHLSDHHERLRGLLTLLGRERALLGEGRIDGEALARLAEDKQRALTALADFEQRRRAVRQRLGYSDDHAGDEQAAREQGCLALWRRIRAGAREAARLNRFNGELIGVRMAGNQRLLNDLHALAGKPLYGPDGQALGGDARLSSRA